MNRQQRRKQNKLKQKVFGKTVGKALTRINSLSDTDILQFIEQFKQIQQIKEEVKNEEEKK